MMNNEDMLARLVAQAATDGGDLVTLRAIVEEASELGAQRTLEHMCRDAWRWQAGNPEGYL